MRGDLEHVHAVAPQRLVGPPAVLAGPAKVFLDGAFVSDSKLATVAPGEEFWVFLGVDEAVKLDYKLVKKQRDDQNLFDKKTRRSFGVSEASVEMMRREALLASDDFPDLGGPPMILLGLILGERPDMTSVPIDEIVLGQFAQKAYMQVKASDGGEAGSSYYLDNFALMRPVSATNIALAWSAAGEDKSSGYSIALDQQAGTLPPQQVSTSQATATLALPAGGTDGLWYAHVRARATDGAWSAATHFPLLIDREPPAVTDPFPSANGAGSPDEISARAADTGGGVDPFKLQVTIDGKAYGFGSGVRAKSRFRLYASSDAFSARLDRPGTA